MTDIISFVAISEEISQAILIGFNTSNYVDICSVGVVARNVITSDVEAKAVHSVVTIYVLILSKGVNIEGRNNGLAIYATAGLLIS